MKIIKNPSFKINLALWLITLVAIATTFFFGIYYNLSISSQNKLIKENLNKLSLNKVDYLNVWINNNKKYIKSLSFNTDLDNIEQFEKLLSRNKEILDSFQEIFLTNDNGDIIYSSLNSTDINVSDREYFSLAKSNKDYISEKLISKTTQDQVIIISSPIVKSGNFDGIIAGVIEISKISNLITMPSVENINKTFIVSKDCSIISNSKEFDTKNEILLQTDNYKKFVNDALTVGHFVNSYINYDGQRVFGAFSPLNHNSWVLISEFEVSKQMALLKQSSVIAGAITLVLTIFLIIPFIIYLSNKLTRPLNTISNMASELALGNFSKRIRYDSDNEIGMLAKSFNAMADRLQSTYLELRKKISHLNSQKEEINLKNLKLQQVIEVNKTILKQLAAKNEELEQVNKVKAEFLSTMTHELRTPMNSIIGYTEMILDGTDGDINEEQEKDLNIILKSSENLLGIINDVLNISKVEAGKMTYNFKRFNLIDIIYSLIEDIRVIAQSKQLELVFEYDKDLPEIYSDPDKISHIITNLLSNAMKFTEKGFIKVSVKSENKQYAEISVQDTGMGIPPQEKDTIFDEFKQIDGSSTRRHGGTGLGLAIAKAFTEGIGGKISVESTVGQGSIFTIKIPVTKFSNIIEEPKEEITSEVLDINIKDDDKKRVVVVTKNSSNYHAISDILSDYDFNVFDSDYPNAIQKIKAIKPGCIFIDIDVPCTNCCDGWTTLLDLQQDRIAGLIPKIVITTQIDNNLCFTLGAEDYLIKPIKKQELINSINRCFSDKLKGYTLLIDDNKDNISLISKVIRKNTPYSTLIVTSLKDVTNVLESSNMPKIIILNASLSTVKPFELIKKINKFNPNKKIPVIIISDRDLSKLEQEFMKQNTNKILTKADIKYSKIVGEIKKIMTIHKNMLQ